MQKKKSLFWIKFDFAAANLFTGLIHWESRACIIGQGGICSPLSPLMLQASSTEVHLGWVAAPLGNPPVPWSHTSNPPASTHLLATKISSADFPPAKQKPYFKWLLILQSVLLSMLLEHKLRAETLLLDQRSGNDRPAVEPAQLATCFCTAQRARKDFYIFKRLGKVRGIIFGGTRSFLLKFKCSCQ